MYVCMYYWKGIQEIIVKGFHSIVCIFLVSARSVCPGSYGTRTEEKAVARALDQR